MTTEKAKQVLADEIKRAVEFNRRGDVVMRGQVLRNIEDLPLPTRYVDAAIKAANLT
jgi:hypothetical protein